MLYISDYAIDYAWASIHDNGHMITVCDVWLQQHILVPIEPSLFTFGGTTYYGNQQGTTSLHAADMLVTNVSL